MAAIPVPDMDDPAVLRQMLAGVDMARAQIDRALRRHAGDAAAMAAAIRGALPLLGGAAPTTTATRDGRAA